MDSERLYAFKLNFAMHMVKTSGSFSDYKRLRDVHKEALAAGYNFALNYHCPLDGGEAAQLVPFPSSRLAQCARVKPVSEARR